MANERFSYQVVNVKAGIWGIKTDALQAELNRLGAQGWELVSSSNVGTAVRLILKRAQ